MGRRLPVFLALLVSVAMLSAACAQAADEVAVSAQPAAAPTTESTAPAAAPDVEAVDESAPEVATPEPVVYSTGREALAAQAGKPHVLWFWAPN